jgi:hypothetical protein
MDNIWDCIIVGGGGSHAAAAVMQSLMADEYGLAVPEGRRHVNA